MNDRWRAVLACVLGVMMMCACASAAGFSVSTSVNPEKAMPGETVKASVTLTAVDAAIRGMQAVISVPDGMSYEGQNSPSGWTDYADGASILAVTGGSLQPGNSVKFEVLLKVNQGTLDTQTVSFSKIRAATAAAESVGGSVSEDSLDIGIGETGTPGDASGDGNIDIVDLVAIIDYIVSDTSPASLANADANGDKMVDILDLVWVIDQIVGG
ncbi:MAG: dockerin type I repeat-containing protein [Christensenellales bacterium]